MALTDLLYTLLSQLEIKALIPKVLELQKLFPSHESIQESLYIFIYCSFWIRGPVICISAAIPVAHFWAVKEGRYQG